MQKWYFLGSNLILDLPFIGCVDLDQIIELSLPQSSHLWNGDNNSYIHNIVIRIKYVLKRPYIEPGHDRLKTNATF